jgi:hypothetical protein
VLLPRVCEGFVGNMPGVFQGFARFLPGHCQDFARIRPGLGLSLRRATLPIRPALPLVRMALLELLMRRVCRLRVLLILQVRVVA